MSEPSKASMTLPASIAIPSLSPPLELQQPVDDDISTYWLKAIRDAPLERLRDSPARCFDTYGYALISKTPQSIAFALTVKQHFESWKPILANNRTMDLISGGVQQYYLHKLPHYTSIFQISQFEELVNHCVQAMDLRDALEERRLTNCPKLLVAPPGQGEQAVHFDAGEPGNTSALTVLLFCTDTVSTSLPRFPRGLLPFPLPSPALQAKSRSILLDRQFYHHTQVSIGDMLVFEHGIPHFGSKNTGTEDRLVFFDLFPKTFDGERPQITDDYQTFSWTYISHIYGTQSLEFLNAILSNTEHEPLDHFADDETKEETQEDLRNVLRTIDHRLQLGLFDVGIKKKSVTAVEKKSPGRPSKKLKK